MHSSKLLLSIILSLLASLAGYATSSPQSELAACEARGGDLWEGEFGLLRVRHSKCVMPGEPERSEEYKMACIESGRNVSTDKWGLYAGCYTPRQREPIVFTKSSVPDIEVKGYEPTTCRTTVNGNTADTRCF